MSLNPKSERTLEEWYSQFHDDHDSLKKDLTKRQLEHPPKSQDKSLGIAYAQFLQQHDELKSDFFSSLPTRPASTPWSAAHFSISTRTFQLAICLLVIVSVFSIPSLLLRPAYALDDVFSRVNNARSLFISGYNFSWNERIPIEFYAKSPHSFWTTIYKTMRVDGKVLVETGYRASDGYVLHQGSNSPPDSARISTFARRDSRVWSNIEMLHRLSKTVGDEMFFSSTEGFDFLGQETFEGIHCDVFERITGKKRQVLYVAPQLKAPVGAACYPLDSETPLWVIDRIALDPHEIPDHAQIQAPNMPVEDLPTAQSRFSDGNPTRIQIPFALHLGNSTLVCWADPHNTVVKPIDFELASTTGGQVPASIHDLGQTNDGETTWNWVQLIPSDPPRSSLSVKVTQRFSRTIVPIELEADAIINAVISLSSDDLPTNRNRILESIGIMRNHDELAPQI